MKISVLYALTVLSAVFPTAATAQSSSWTYVEASYVESELDDVDLPRGDLSDPNGWEVTGSLGISELLFVQLGYSEQSDDDATRPNSISGILYPLKFDLEIERLSVGVGLIWGVNDSTDVYGQLNYEDWSVEVSTKALSVGQTLSEDFDENGLTAAVGVRAIAWATLELRGEFVYSDIVEEFGFEAGAYYTFADHFTIGASFKTLDELETIRATVRYQF